MNGRIEYKYLAHNESRDAIRDAMRPYVVADTPPVTPSSSEYTVRSVYYDTPYLDCYSEKADGLQMRNKFRIRGYGARHENSIVFLEIKRKCDAFIEKHRAPLYHRDLHAFFQTLDVDTYIIGENGRRFEKTEALRFLHHYLHHNLRPAALVVYDREAFFGRFDSSLRLTLDTNVRGSLFPSLERLHEEAGVMPAMQHHFIFEVKFFRNSLPAWVKTIVRRFGLQRLALSKYAICVDSGAARETLWRMRRRQFAALGRRR